MPDYAPLQITAWLQTPVIADAFLPLDGVLLFMAMRERYGPQDVSQSGRGVFDERTQLSHVFVEHHAGTPHWFPACSFAQWQGTVTEDTGYWHKRLDLQYGDVLTPPRSRVVTQNGRYRSYRMPVFTRHALAVVWYALADRARLEHLLRFVVQLGKKGTQGYGMVKAWQVAPCAADWSVVGPQGQLMRAVPAVLRPDAQGPVLPVGFRPSYWEQKNQALCVVPH
jgi:CRISPR type IV-associated protein Csf3